MQFGLNTADGYDGGVLPLLRFVQLTRLVVAEPRPDGVLLSRLERLPDDRTLDLLGVRYLIANAGTPGRPGLQATDFGDLVLFTRDQATPRSLVVYRATAVATDEAALDQMRRPTFDPNHELVLHAPATGASPASNAPGAAIVPDVQTSDRWRARVTLSEPGYVLQREAWYPGWRARVDGVDTPVERADILFRAVPLPAGEHDVEIFFEPATFSRGVLVSAAALAIVLVLLGLDRLLILRTRDLR
jgi:hypothetical protein